MDIKVDFGSLSGLADDIASQASTLQGTLEGLQGRIKPAIAQWEGNSGGAYAASQAKWDQAAEDLQQVLAQIGTGFYPWSECAAACRESWVSR